MCKYVTKKELKPAKKVVLQWINKVHKYMKSNYNITFQHYPIGSGKRNMVIKNCKDNFFDLDYELEVISWPNNYDINDAKDLKYKFKMAFDKSKPQSFNNCEDSTQSLSSENENLNYGLDVIITRYNKNNYYILRNNKNRNKANNNDYQWAEKIPNLNTSNNLEEIKKYKLWNELRDIYKNKKHESKDINKNSPQYKHSYQILNEAINDTITKFKNKI